MDVREKLVELICMAHHNASCVIGYDGSEEEALEEEVRYLIASGVTVQEWISVKDRRPEVGGYVVCIAKRNPFSRFMPMVARIEKNGWVNPITEQYISEVTHWIPIHQPPKGE